MKENYFSLLLNIKQNYYFFRSNVSHGLWLSALIPLCYFVNVYRGYSTLEFQYKLSSIISIGLGLQSHVIYRQLGSDVQTVTDNVYKALPTVCIAVLLFVTMKQGNFSFFCSRGL